MVFNIDRIGNGASDHPDGLLVDLDSSAYTIHQVVQKLRSGSLLGRAFTRIHYIGHSYGSFVGVRLASTYQNDVDSVVLTGYAHNLDPSLVPMVPTVSIPAQLDPKFGVLFPLNYLSITQLDRPQIFFYSANCDPNIILQDWLGRDVFSTRTFDDIVSAIALPETLSITKPVHIVVGQYDMIFCGGLTDCSSPDNLMKTEGPHFAPAANLKITTMPNCGHDINLHYNYMDAFDAINAWLNSLRRL